MKFPLVTAEGATFRLLLIRPNWSAAPVVTYRMDTHVGEGRTTIEERRPARAAFLITQRVLLSLDGTDSDDWRKGTAALGTNRVAIPLWVDAVPVAQWADRIHEPGKVINFTPGTADYAIYDASALPGVPAHSHYAPLMLARWTKRPPAAPDNEEQADVTIELTEARPWAWRIGVNSYGAGWVKAPNWLSRPVDVSDYGLELVQLPGAAAEPGTDRVNAAARWRQEGDFCFLSRLEIRQALTVFADKRGAWGTIAPLPAWFQPGASSTATPDNYTARFASDKLSLTYASQELAMSRIAFLQEVSTPGRDQNLPPEIYLYRLVYEHDAGNPELFTNYDAPLTAAEGDYQPAQFSHLEIVRSLKPQEEKAEVQMAYVAGSLAADWLLAKLYGLVSLTIWKCDPADPGGTRGDPLFTGKLQDVRPEGNTLTLTATLFGKLLERRVPGWVFGPRCNVCVFSELCGLVEADHDSAGTAAAADLSADRMTLTVHGVTGWGGPTYPDNWFAYGTLRTGAGRQKMIATIISSTMDSGNVVVKLNRPVQSDYFAGGGQAVTLVPGCDGQKSTCVEKFDNYDPADPDRGFRGFPFIPEYIESRALGAPKAPKK